MDNLKLSGKTDREVFTSYRQKRLISQSGEWSPVASTEEQMGPVCPSATDWMWTSSQETDLTQVRICCLGRHLLTGYTDCFGNPLEPSEVSVWERTHRKHFCCWWEPLKWQPQGAWSNTVHTRHRLIFCVFYGQQFLQHSHKDTHWDIWTSDLEIWMCNMR